VDVGNSKSASVSAIIFFTIFVLYLNTMNDTETTLINAAEGENYYGVVNSSIITNQ
jgi:hypothetical protein